MSFPAGHGDRAVPADGGLERLCGSAETAEKAQQVWDDLMDKKRLDLSGQHLSDAEVTSIFKGLYLLARTTGYQTERMKPLPITEIDCSGNDLTAKGIDEVVQFVRTAGANASIVDLSDNKLDDNAAPELARLVKNYSSFSNETQNLLGTLLLSGNEIGKEGATKLIQYAHWSAFLRYSPKILLSLRYYPKILLSLS